MLMMFYTLREDLLPASRAIAVRIRSVIPKIQLWHVCLTGKYEAVKQKEVLCVFHPFFLFLFSSSLARSIDLCFSKPSISSISNVYGSLFYTCDHSLQKHKLSPLSCCIIWSAIFPHVMSPSFVIKIDTGFMRADIFWTIQKSHHHSTFLLLLF